MLLLLYFFLIVIISFFTSSLYIKRTLVDLFYTNLLTFPIVSSVYDYKGLESDVIIYVHENESSKNLDYIAYTRARYYLYELELHN